MTRSNIKKLGTKREKSKKPLQVWLIGGCGSNYEFKLIDVPKLDPKDEEKRLMVQSVDEYGNIENIQVPGTTLRRVFLNGKRKKDK